VAADGVEALTDTMRKNFPDQQLSLTYIRCMQRLLKISECRVYAPKRLLVRYVGTPSVTCGVPRFFVAGDFSDRAERAQADKVCWMIVHQLHDDQALVWKAYKVLETLTGQKLMPTDSLRITTSTSCPPTAE
jgi:hypothetical protein